MPTEKRDNSNNRRPRGRPRLEDVAAIEDKVLEIALDEFLEHGYGGASVTRIVKKAGVSKTTVYSRFSSKEALFNAIMQKQILQVAPETLLDSGEEKPNLEAGLNAYANKTLALSLEEGTLGVNRLMYSESHRFPEVGAAVTERSRLGKKRIADFIRVCAISDGIPCEDAESVAEVFILLTRGWYINAMLTNENVPENRRQQWVSRAVKVLLSSREDW